MFPSIRGAFLGSSLHHALIYCTHLKLLFCPVLLWVHAMRWLQNWLGSQRRQSRATRLLRQQIESHDRIRLAIGAESDCSEDWIAAECDQLDLVNSASWSCFLQKSSVDAILAEQVWEHLSEQDGKTAARNCFQFLRPGGYLRVAVPDGFHPSQQRQMLRSPDSSETSRAEHGSLYNHRSFAEVFLQAGFQVQLIEYFDKQGVFHSHHWDVSKGLIKRTLLFDDRNLAQPFAYTSLVLDAVKPSAAAMGLESNLSGVHEMEAMTTSGINVGCQKSDFQPEAA